MAPLASVVTAPGEPIDTSTADPAAGSGAVPSNDTASDAIRRTQLRMGGPLHSTSRSQDRYALHVLSFMSIPPWEREALRLVKQLGQKSFRNSLICRRSQFRRSSSLDSRVSGAADHQKSP